MEMAVAMCEAGARAVYCLDFLEEPSPEFKAAQAYLGAMDFDGGQRPRLEYVRLDVTDQQAVWKKVEEIGDREGRMDVCVAAAGILKTHTDCLRYSHAIVTLGKALFPIFALALDLPETFFEDKVRL